MGRGRDGARLRGKKKMKEEKKIERRERERAKVELAVGTLLSETFARPMRRRLYRFTTERRTSVKRYLLTVDFPWSRRRCAHGETPAAAAAAAGSRPLLSPSPPPPPPRPPPLGWPAGEKIAARGSYCSQV